MNPFELSQGVALLGFLMFVWLVLDTDDGGDPPAGA